MTIRPLAPWACALFCLGLAGPAFADTASDLSRLVGWEIVYSGTVTGHITDKGEVKPRFEGCRHGRKLILDKKQVWNCKSQRSGFGYEPKAVLLKKGSQWKLIVGDETYDVAR